MKHPTFKRYGRGERLSAQEYNRVVNTVAANAGSLHIQGYADSTGFHTRRAPTQAVVVTRSAKIQTGGIPSNAVGPFTCKLLDADGNVVGDTISVWPREHLGTNDFDSGNVYPAYTTDDNVPIYKDVDGKWYTHNVFDDLMPGVARTCRIQAGGVPSNAVGPFVCKLLDSEGAETGDPINVWPNMHLGTNNFDSTDVHPNLSAADYIPILKDLDGEWYTTFVFDDTIDCICNT